MCGAAAGVLLRSRLPQRALELAAQGIALVVLILGTGMALKSEQPLIMTVSIAAGSLIGELLGIEGACRTEGEGQKAGGSKIQRFPEEGQRQGKLRQAQGGQGVHKGVLEA